MRSLFAESSLLLRTDILLDIATFLARRWTDNMRIQVVLTEQKIPITRPDKKQIFLPGPRMFPGNELQRYRQWRVMLWYESMRMMYCTKVLSYDHVFGFLLNTLETKRSEILGLRLWNGMEKEIIFYEGISWLSRPLLNSLYGKHKVAEAFSQYFLTGSLKGELFGNDLRRVQNRADFAKNVLNDIIANNQGTSSIEKRIPEILKILELNALGSFPVITPLSKIGLGRSVDKKNLISEIEKFVKLRNLGYKGAKNSEEIIEGREVVAEFKALLEESKRSERRGNEGLLQPGLSIPEDTSYDESQIYDVELIQQTKQNSNSGKRSGQMHCRGQVALGERRQRIAAGTAVDAEKLDSARSVGHLWCAANKCGGEGPPQLRTLCAFRFFSLRANFTANLLAGRRRPNSTDRAIRAANAPRSDSRAGPRRARAPASEAAGKNRPSALRSNGRRPAKG